MLLSITICFICALVCVHSVSVKVDKLWFESCPNVDGPVAILKDKDVKSHRVENADHSRKFGSAQVQKFEFVDKSGSSHELNFPGCYDLKLTLKFNVSLTKPYAETYVDVNNGQLKPCEDFEEQNPYCKSSDNFMLGVVTQNIKTCKFCDPCLKKEKVVDNAKEYANDFKINENSNICESGTIDAGQQYEATIGPICLPSRLEMEKKLGGRIKSWNIIKNTIYGRHGTMVAILHILDRPNPIPKICLDIGKSKKDPVDPQTRQMCDGKLKEQRDSPESSDIYIGCYMAAINFSQGKLI